MASKDVIALANRIREEFGIPVEPEKFYRTYTGKHQRAAGECTWVIYAEGPCPVVVGGFEPIRKYITKRNQLAISERHFHGYALYATAPGEPGYIRSANCAEVECAPPYGDKEDCEFYEDGRCKAGASGRNRT